MLRRRACFPSFLRANQRKRRLIDCYSDPPPILPCQLSSGALIQQCGDDPIEVESSHGDIRQGEKYIDP